MSSRDGWHRQAGGSISARHLKHVLDSTHASKACWCAAMDSCAALHWHAWHLQCLLTELFAVVCIAHASPIPVLQYALALAKADCLLMETPSPIPLSALWISLCTTAVCEDTDAYIVLNGWFLMVAFTHELHYCGAPVLLFTDASPDTFLQGRSSSSLSFSLGSLSLREERQRVERRDRPCRADRPPSMPPHVR
jgi:hypothetical protein